MNAERAASQVTVATAEGVDEPAQQPARQSRRAGAGEQATPHELEEDFVAFLCSECGVCERCEACSQLESVFETPLELVCDSDYGSNAMPRKQRLELGKLLSEQIAMLELMDEDFGYKFGAVPEAFMANLAELQLCVTP